MNKTEHSSKGPCDLGPSVPAYLQGEMSASDRALFEVHLQTCATCRAEAERYRDLMDVLLKSSPDVQVRDLVPGIEERLRAERDSGRRIPFPVLLRIAAAFVCAAALAVLIVKVRNGASRAAIVVREPATAYDQFVASALEWLHATQEPAGNWDAEKWGAQRNYTPGVSGLAILAFLRQDRDGLRGAHAEAIRRGVNYLLSQQTPDGRFGIVCSGTPYNQGIATMAILEAYAQEKNPEWKAAADRSLAYIRSTQRDSGGWGYPREIGKPGNTSITVWQLQPLIRAASLGWRDLGKPIEDGLAWLTSMSDEEGRIGYSRASEFPNGYQTLTAAGALCLLIDPDQAADSERLRRVVSALHRAAEDPGDVDYYRAYFLSRALQLSGSDRAGELVSEMREALIACQTKGGALMGSCFVEDQWFSAGGRVYATAMAVLAM